MFAGKLADRGYPPCASLPFRVIFEQNDVVRIKYVKISGYVIDGNSLSYFAKLLSGIREISTFPITAIFSLILPCTLSSKLKT